MNPEKAAYVTRYGCWGNAAEISDEFISLTGFQVLPACINTKFQLISFDYRQQNCFLPVPFFNEVMCLYFIIQ